MGKIVLDDSLRAQLNGLNEQLEFYDEAGDRVGWFLPEAVYRGLLRAQADARWPAAEEERLAQQTDGRALAEIWKDLGRT